MTEGILIALITGGISLAGSLLSAAHTKNLILYRIEQLEKKQDKHNSLIERMYAVEKAVEVLDNREKVSEHRIDDLEKRGQ